MFSRTFCQASLPAVLFLALAVLCPSHAWAQAAGPPAKPPAATDPQIQVAILLDTSNSMDGLINQARAHLWKIVNEFALARRDGRRPKFEAALFEYGNDGLPAEGGHIRLVVPLTTNLDLISEELFRLTTNGGSEHCGQVIDAAVRQLSWSESNRDLKCIFIAGNEPFTQGPVNYRDACRAAAAKGIMVNTIHCGPNDVGIETMWQDGAKLADGSYVCIDQDQVLADIPTPQDEELASLSSQLNTTYIAYGSAETREAAMQRQAAQDVNAAQAGSGSASTRARSKASHVYDNAQWDFVDACQRGKVKVEDIKAEDLPEELRAMSLKEREAYVAAKTQERAELQARIKDLSAARDKYVSAERAKQAESGAETLDTAVIKATREQATKKEFQFEQ